MNTENKKQNPTFQEIWVVSQAAAYVTNQACTISARHINDGIVRLQFNREVAYYARSIVRDVEQGKKSVGQGLIEIKKEQRSLLNQSLEVARKGVGLVAGALQFKTGAEICFSSFGTLCVLAGAPMKAHGANNVYENGRNLWEGHSNTKGPVRELYRRVAVEFGGDEALGDKVYGIADLAMSGYGAMRLILKPDSWRLFRYVRTDYIRGYQKVGPGSRAADIGAGVLTLDQLLDDARE